MAIAAHLGEAHLEGERSTSGRREPRRELRLEVRLEASGGLAPAHSANVLVHNVSATGLLIESEVVLDVGEAIAIDLPETGSRLAHVIWASERLFGCEFDSPIGTAALSAAQLRSAVADRAPVTPHADVAGESFGMRLQRLRKQVGMSLGTLAAQLGVSKPTVWAWEQGRSRPIESRIADLARAFGISEAELSGNRDEDEVQDVVRRSREAIAAAFGTRADKVRIMIEL